MTDDTAIRDTLRTLAESGPDPDEDAAWAQVTAAIRADEIRRRRRLLAGAGVGIATTAAAVALLAGFAGDVDQAVDVGPAAPSSAPAATDTTQGESQVGTPVTLPADPIVVVDAGGAAVHVLDATTGERAATPFGPLPSAFRVLDASITVDGTIYATVAEAGGPISVVRGKWDGADGFEPIDLPALSSQSDSYGEPTISPDGRTLALSLMRGRGDGSVDGSLGLLDTATGEFRELTWPAGDLRSLLAVPGELSFSPDGTTLAFANVQDTDGTEASEGYVVDLDATSLGEATLVSDEVWDLVFTPDGGLLGLVGPMTAEAQLRYLSGGPDVGIPELDGVLRLEATSGSVVAAIEEQWFRHDAETDRWVEVPYANWAG